MFEPVDISQMKENIQKVFNSEECLNSECISLFDILSLYRELKEDRKRVKEEIDSKLAEKLKFMNCKYYVEIQDFDYETSQVCVTLKNKNSEEITKIYFSNNSGNFDIFKVEGQWIFDDIFGVIAVCTENWYNYCYALRDVEVEGKFNVKSINSPFFINISYVCLCAYYNKTNITSDLKIIAFYDENTKFYCRCTNEEISSLIKQRGNEFLKNIFVKICECPEWMQGYLIFERREYLKERKKQKQSEMIESVKLTQKQKRRKFWKKILPFVK